MNKALREILFILYELKGCGSVPLESWNRSAPRPPLRVSLQDPPRNLSSPRLEDCDGVDYALGRLAVVMSSFVIAVDVPISPDVPFRHYKMRIR